VLIGGFAAQQHGAMRRTEDIDVTPATDLDNPSTRPGSPDTPTASQHKSHRPPPDQ